MSLLLIGLNHRSAPIEVREKLSALPRAFFPAADGTSLETASLFTCNRVEIYFFGFCESAEVSFKEWLTMNSLNPEEFEPFLYRFRDVEAAKHLFRVAASLDSMILGETQILHQIKECYQASVNTGSVGKHLHMLFQKALEVGKRVRSETMISENTVSVASTAVELAMHIFGPLNGSRALVIGAGEMASLVAFHLKKHEIGKMRFINRTFEKARDLAREFSGEAHEFDSLPRLLVDADVIISSTGSRYPIITSENLKQALSIGNRNKPIFLIDIAVPRDISSECGDMENVFLYNIDDLQAVADDNLGQRRVEAEKAETIISYEAGIFQSTLEAFTVVPLIKSLREKAEEIRRAEMEKFIAGKKDISPELLEEMNQCTKTLMAKWLHNPILGLKERGAASQSELELIAGLFGLPDKVMPKAPIFLTKKQKDKAI